MLILQGITYAHPDKTTLFTDLHLSVNRHDKIALVGNNGAGKSTLLKLMAGSLIPSAGQIKTNARLYYVPQLFDQYHSQTIAQALGIDDKLTALHNILEGRASDESLALLDNDWDLEERCKEAFAYWQLDSDVNQKIDTLSGGQKTKALLAGINILRPELVLLDEPTNHLDSESRKLLYDYVRSTPQTLVIVSHDRMLLNLLNPVCELSKQDITVYGGNYDFYKAQKLLESEALNRDVKGKEKALRKAKETEKEAMERRQKLDARGKKKQEQAGLPKIMMNTFKNNAEKSTARMKSVHAEKQQHIAEQLKSLRDELPGMDQMKLSFDNSALHQGKLLVSATQLNFGYQQLLWKNDLNFRISSGERMAVKGANGSGKTALLKLILGELEPTTGTIERTALNAVYIDQEYSLINHRLTVYEQAQQYNTRALQEHELKTRLSRFLFTQDYWNKPCAVLSGGERMRLILCCLTIGNQAPDMIVLDEPTNNLDIQNTEILTAAVNGYKGTLLVVSHDAYFLKCIHAEQAIVMS